MRGARAWFAKNNPKGEKMIFRNLSGYPKVFSRLAFIIFAVITFSSIGVNHASAQRAAFDFESVDAFIQTEMESIRLPGLALAIVHGDEIVYQKGYGIADPSGNPITPQTPFNIGSVSKAFTALTVMQLAEDGALELDAPAQRYLPWFHVADAEASTRITILDLLNHTSGIPTTAGNDYADKDDTSDQALEHRVRALSNVELDRPVGSNFEYSNANYDILGLIVQAVSGQPYEQVVRQNILIPLDMNNSFSSREEAIQHSAASGYRMWFGFPFPYSETAPRAHLPSGQQFSSAEDLAHLLIAHLNSGNFQDNSVLSPAWIESMQSTPVSSGRDCATYSLHWSHNSRCDSSTLGLSGDTANFKARILVDKDENLAVIVLMNAQAVGINGPRQDRIDDGVLDLLREQLPTSTSPHNIQILASMGLIAVVTAAFIFNGLRSNGTKRQIILPLAFAILWLLMLAGMVNLAAGSLSNHPLAFMLENIPDLGWMIAVSAFVVIFFGVFRITTMLRAFRG